MPSKPTINKVTKKRTSISPRRASTTVEKKTVTKRAKTTTPVIATTTAQPSSRRQYHLGMQFAIASSAIVVLVLLATVDRQTFATNQGDAAVPPVTISLDHQAPLSLTVLFAKKEQSAYVSLTNRSVEDIHISVPSRWKRTEVTGTDIANVVQSVPSFGFAKYSLPAGAGIKMHLPDPPESVFFDSTSDAVTAVDLTTIDLTTSAVSNGVFLLQKQLLLPLWIGAE